MSTLRRLAWAAIASILVVSLAACGGSSSTEGNSGGAKTIGITLLDTTEPFYKDMTVGFQQEASKLGWKLNITAAEGDLAAQINQVQNFITNKVDGIVLIAADSDGIVPAVKKANAAKIPVITADAHANGGDLVSFVASNHKQGGVLAGAYLAKTVLHGKGTVAILDYAQSQVIRERDDGFKEALAKYPGISIVKKIEVGYDREKARAATQDLLTGYPDLSAIYAPVGGDAGNGAVQALTAARNTHVKVVTFDSIPENQKLMANHNPNLVGDIAQFPYRIGIKALQVLDDYWHGKKVAAFYPVPIALVTQSDLVIKNGKVILKGHQADVPPSQR